MYKSRSGMFFCLVGPAGSGKSSLGEALLKHYKENLTLSVSATSRHPRPNETQGMHYDFISKDEFQNRVDSGYFLEWEETHGNLYGTPKSFAERTLAGEFDLLLDIDIRGALRFWKKFPDNCVNVLLLPPDMKTLRNRLEAREGSSKEEISVRFETAEKEYEIYRECFQKNPNPLSYVLINEDFEKSFKALCAVYMAAGLRSSVVRDSFIHDLLSLEIGGSNV